MASEDSGAAAAGSDQGSSDDESVFQAEIEADVQRLRSVLAMAVTEPAAASTAEPVSAPAAAGAEIPAPVEATTSALEHAVQCNRAYQQVIRDQLLHVREAIEANAKLQKQARNLLEQRKRLRYVYQAPSDPSFGNSVEMLPRRMASLLFSVNGQAPPANPDLPAVLEETAELRAAQRLRSWNTKDRNMLQRGVRQLLYEKCLAASAQQYRQAVHQNPEQYQSLRAKLTEDEERIKQCSIAELQQLSRAEDVEWEQVVRRFLPARSAMECQLMWTNVVDPSINHSAWTRAEDAKLRELARKHGGYDWQRIAEELRTGRRGWQALTRYQQRHHEQVKTKWSKEEDEKLRQAVAVLGEGHWEACAAMIPGRNCQQCLHRWQKSLAERRRGRWLGDEDIQLVLASLAHKDGAWNMMSEHVPTRTDVQVRERWCNVSSPDVAALQWTQAEDTQLNALVQQHGQGNWSLIARNLPGRTDSMVARRWHKLEKHAAEAAGVATGGKRRRSKVLGPPARRRRVNPVSLSRGRRARAAADDGDDADDDDDDDDVVDDAVQEHDGDEARAAADQARVDSNGDYVDA